MSRFGKWLEIPSLFASWPMQEFGPSLSNRQGEGLLESLGFSFYPKW